MRNQASPFIDACYGKEAEYTPVWFMRQAGRYLPSYRRIKGSRGVLELAKNADLASEVVVTAVRELGVDAAILFADIMLPLEAIGVDLEIKENFGPVIADPIASVGQVSSLGRLDPETDLPFLGDAIQESIRKLDGMAPLIGFSGAPFTLAAYMLEGGPSRELYKAKRVMYSDPDLWRALMRKLTDVVKSYLGMQVNHGVAAIQLFDSWVGCLSPTDYDRYVLPYTREILASLSSVPKIHFCADSSALIEEFHKAGPDVLSVDWRTPVGAVWTRCGSATSVQGNLDPVLALTGGEQMERGLSDVLDSAAGRRGHIFNLGHGVLPETDPSSLRSLVRLVHERTRHRR